MFKFLFGVILTGTGLFRTVFHDPVWGLYLFAVFSHVRLEQLGENVALPLRIPIVIACLTLFLYVIGPTYRPKFSKWPAEVWLFGIMVLSMCLSSARAHFVPELSWNLTFDYFKYWVFLVLFIQMVDSIEKVEGFHRIMILSSAWLVYRCWDLRYTTGLRFENLGGGNVTDANHFAAALVLLFPFVFHKTLSPNWPVTLGAAVLCFGIVMAVLISLSRGGFLGLVTLVILIALSFRAQRKKVLAAVLILGLLAAPFVSMDQKQRLFTIFNATREEERDSSAQSRIEVWELAFQLFKEHPLVGVGPENFSYYSGYMVQGLPYGEPGHVTHSIWFEMLSQGGLFLSVPFVILLVRFFRNSLRLGRRYRVAGKNDLATYVHIPMIALGAFLVPATFLDRSVYEPIYWCIGLGVVHRYISEQILSKAGEEESSQFRSLA